MAERGDEQTCQDTPYVVFLELVLVVQGCSICDTPSSCILLEICTFLYVSLFIFNEKLRIPGFFFFPQKS